MLGQEFGGGGLGSEEEGRSEGQPRRTTAKDRETKDEDTKKEEAKDGGQRNGARTRRASR